MWDLLYDISNLEITKKNMLTQLYNCKMAGNVQFL